MPNLIANKFDSSNKSKIRGGMWMQIRICLDFSINPLDSYTLLQASELILGWASTEGALLPGSLGVHLWGPEVWGPYLNEQHKCNNIIFFHAAPAPAWCACVCVCVRVCACKYVCVCVCLFVDRFVLRAGALQIHDDYSPLLPPPFHSLQIHIICDKILAFTPSATTKGLTLFRACERARHLWQRGPYPKGACMSLRNFSNSLRLLLRDDVVTCSDNFLWWWYSVMMMHHHHRVPRCWLKENTHTLSRYAMLSCQERGRGQKQTANNLFCTQICFQFSCRFAGEIPQCDWID